MDMYRTPAIVQKQNADEDCSFVCVAMFSFSALRPFLGLRKSLEGWCHFPRSTNRCNGCSVTSFLRLSIATPHKTAIHEKTFIICYRSCEDKRVSTANHQATTHQAWPPWH